MPRRKKQRPKPETPVDFTAPGFDPMTLCGNNFPRGPWHFKACFHFASQGSAPHQNQVAEYYAEGKVVVKDLAEALHWFRKSEVQGNLYAIRRIGDFYRDGRGVPRNPDTAFRYYRKASVGNPKQTHRAIYELGRCYEEGIGCVPDMARARDLYQQAVDIGGDQKARARLEELDKPKRTRKQRKAIVSRPAETNPQKSAPKVPRPVERASAKQNAAVDIERDWTPFIGTCGLHAMVEEFLEEDERKWLEDLCNAVNDMFPDKPQLRPDSNNRTVQSYRNTISALVNALNEAACKTPEILELEVALEYVIPADYSDPDGDGIVGLRADAIVFGKDRVAVLEFKTGESTEKLAIHKAEAIGQVNDYLRGLNKWHRHTSPVNLRGCVVMFALDDTNEKARKPMMGFQPARIVSRGNLVAFLNDCFGEHWMPVQEPHKWLHAFKLPNRSPDAIFREIADYAFDHYQAMPELDGDEKAAIRRRIARRLGLRSPIRLRPLVAALTNGKWQLRDAVVQLLENLPQDRLETLYEGWSQSTN